MNQLLYRCVQDLGIAKYFKGIYGSNSDRIHKADVIRYALSINDLPKEETVIIGDTNLTSLEVEAVGIKSMAVTWELEILKIYFSTHQILFVTLHLIFLRH